MKKLIILFAAALLATGCYDDFVQDYYWDGVLFAYQWDLRTFVLDEGGQFDVTVALGGVMKNTRNRDVKLEVDNSLVDAEAYKGMMGRLEGGLSGDYVSTALQAASVTSLEPLPAAAYEISGMNGLQIKAGRHTAAVTVKATQEFIADPKAYSPAYALGIKIVSADADSVILGKDFAVIAVRCENRFFGNWSHRGTITTYDGSGNVTSQTREVGTLSDDNIFVLSTKSANTLTCNRMTGYSGGMELAFSGDSGTVSSLDGTATGSVRFNGAKLLQDRELFLEYELTYTGGRKVVKDTLAFRNRIRDGINEWQDENIEHYK